MNNVVSLSPRPASSRQQSVRRAEAATIIIFPGIRYERTDCVVEDDRPKPRSSRSGDGRPGKAAT